MKKKLYQYDDRNLDREMVNIYEELAAGTEAAPIVHSATTNLFAKSWVKVLDLPSGETSAERIVYCGNNKMILGTEGTAKIYTSSNSGRTWTAIGSLGSEGTIYGLKYLEDGIAMAGTYPNGKLFRTTNYGATWAEITVADTGKTEIRAIEYLGNGVVLIGNTNPSALGQSGKIWRSTDYGASFSQVYDGSLTADYYYCGGMAYLGNGVVIATLGGGGLGTKTDIKILKSEDSGATWAVAATITGNVISLMVCNLGDGIALIDGSNSGNIYKTTDYGDTWVSKGQNPAAAPIIDGLFNAGGGIVLAGTGDSAAGTTKSARLIRSDDYGETWSVVQELYDGVTRQQTLYTLAMTENRTLVAGTYVFGGIGQIWRCSLAPVIAL